MKSTTTVHHDADGRLLVDIRCVKCGYNLRSLRTDGACSECGESVSVSIARSSAPRIRRRVRVALYSSLGAWLAYSVAFGAGFMGLPIGAVPLVATGLVLSFIGLFSSIGSVVGLRGAPRSVLPTLIVSFVLSASAIAVVGYGIYYVLEHGFMACDC